MGHLTPGLRAGLELRSSGKPVAVQPIVKSCPRHAELPALHVFL